MANFDNNPLIPAILQVLREQLAPIGIHHLLAEVKKITELPSLDEDAQLALFRLNWLMMNALFQLQQACFNDGYYLHISTLDIHLRPYQANDQHTLASEISCQPLKQYYLDWQHFSQTTREEVQALLEGMWAHYTSADAQQNAYHVLGLEQGASFTQIRKTYRSLASRFHPDHGGDAVEFIRVREAYEVLAKAHSFSADRDFS